MKFEYELASKAVSVEERSEFWEQWVTEYLGVEDSECRLFLPEDLVTIKMR